MTALTVLFLVLVITLYVVSLIIIYSLVTFSLKRSILEGRDLSAGDVFFVFVGWSVLAVISIYLLEIPMVIYYYVNRNKISQTKANFSALTRKLAVMNAKNLIKDEDAQEWEDQ